MMANENLEMYFTGADGLVQELKAKIKVLESEIVYLKERNRFLQDMLDELIDSEFVRGED